MVLKIVVWKYSPQNVTTRLAGRLVTKTDFNETAMEKFQVFLNSFAVNEAFCEFMTCINKKLRLNYVQQHFDIWFLNKSTKTELLMLPWYILKLYF